MKFQLNSNAFQLLFFFSYLVYKQIFLSMGLFLPLKGTLSKLAEKTQGNIRQHIANTEKNLTCVLVYSELLVVFTVHWKQEQK